MDLIVHSLVLPITFPLLAGFICLVIPRDAYRTLHVVAVVSALVTLAFVWPLFAGPGGRLDVGSWLSVRIDGLSAFVLLAVAVFGVVIAWYSVGYMRGRKRQREYFGYLLWTLGGSCGVVLANDLVVLLVCWGFLGLMLYLMVGTAGPRASDAARKSLMIVGGSDMLLVYGVVMVWSLADSTRLDTTTIPLDGAAAHSAFLTFVAAALAKAGAVPFHAWVPDVGEKADAPVAAFLPASLDKLLGIYLLARCALDLFEMTATMQTMLMVIGAVTILAAVMMALVQHDLKRLLSYHAVSQVGYMVLGIGTGTAVGLAGSLFHMLNNAIYKCCLFLCAGAVEKAAGTTDLDKLGGLAKSMPFTFAACTVAALSISGIPPLNGFASKWMIYQGVISSGEVGGPGWILFLVAAMLGSALTLASFVKVLHATFLCKPSPEIARRSIREVGLSMVVPMTALAALCIVFGVFAYAVPLKWLVIPAVRAETQGVWWAGLATMLILVAIGIGVIIYAVTMASGKLRRVETYIGGERLDDVYISGEGPGLSRHVGVTGVDFYSTVEQLPAVRRFYQLGRAKVFDIYEVSAKCFSYLVTPLRSIQTGALPVYLTWFLFGLLVVIYAIAQVGS